MIFFNLCRINSIDLVHAEILVGERRVFGGFNHIEPVAGCLIQLLFQAVDPGLKFLVMPCRMAASRQPGRKD